MRPSRIAILALFSAASVFILFRSVTSVRRHHAAAYPAEGRTRPLFGFMYYNTPFSLFPPNAAISLTDDNSTSFAARPAAFGPKLAARGLSGQLWVGSGFAEDSLDGNGELGCSDLPGWGTGTTRASLKNSFRTSATRIATKQVKSDHPKRAGQLLELDNRGAVDKGRSEHEIASRFDNTDSHLNDRSTGALSRRDASSPPQHADIQSIQEAAEIQGKVVLLMRGGCGFLEKVMWAQRRGAIAVIVGDNQKGGPLIQMFAHGDEVDNVTVPSVFTARTTAHLLSSLTQPGSFIEDSLDDNGNPVLKVQQGHKSRQGSQKRSIQKRAAAPQKTGPSASTTKRAAAKAKAVSSTSSTPAKRGWFAWLFSWGKSSPVTGDTSRPPSSGRIDWVLVEDWSDEKDKALKDSIGKSKKPGSAHDDFVIGVQDWRDPDLVDKTGAKKDAVVDKPAGQRAAANAKDRIDGPSKNSPEANGPKGGSITPGSGEYNPVSVVQKDGKDAGTKPALVNPATGAKGHGLMSKLFGDDADHKGSDAHSQAEDHHDDPGKPDHDPDSEPHEGLWVTITPTSSATTFFDTLLVLVISPLVTLTVVYALLILISATPVASERNPNNSTPAAAAQHIEAATAIEDYDGRVGEREPIGCKRCGSYAIWVECVVCLEEYVDGVSRVMSLPCGHEFHADCITPWLTTRRRTCPICKGDVVRSLAHGSRGGPRYEPYNEDSDDDLSIEASGSGSSERTPDLESGMLSPRPRDADDSSRQDGWFGLLSNSFATRARRQSPNPPEDRDR
ncbi:RING-9 protein [Purpureocillium lavendulum]|uniref:RING-9 protein n=1 Tax=Purpureocillium lavendulum TaxID=1247861 RepID=A0AB34FX34_9HYPO|nr:RING-9 protein [Purpureocillium lavendulum]